MRIDLYKSNNLQVIHIAIFTDTGAVIDYCWASYNISKNQYIIQLFKYPQNQLIDILIKENICTIVDNDNNDIITLTLTNYALINLL